MKENAALAAVKQTREAVLALRIEVAQRRDDLLTEAEQIAALEVYQECGR